MSATLTARLCPELGAGAALVELDCPHGTTNVLWANAPIVLAPLDTNIVRDALVKHHVEQFECLCIRELWRRYYGGAELGELGPPAEGKEHPSLGRGYRVYRRCSSCGVVQRAADFTRAEDSTSHGAERLTRCPACGHVGPFLDFHRVALPNEGESTEGPI